MNINGTPLQNTCSSIFQLRRGQGEPLTFVLRPLSLGFHQRLRSRGILPPTAPVKIGRDAAGKPLRDAQGLALTLPDLQHPDYVQAVERYHQCVAVLSVVEALQGDERVTFDTVMPCSLIAAEWMEYAGSVFQEMEQAGFTAGDLILLCREICRLSNLINEQLTQAQGNFSQPTAGVPG